MEYTKAYKLSTSGKADQVIYIGKHCKIENFFLFCEANASVSLYITEYLTTKGADGKRRTNTYYIFKDKLRKVSYRNTNVSVASKKMTHIVLTQDYGRNYIIPL